MNFQDIINKDTPVLVDFSAEWCGPCKALAPILKQVKEKLGDRITILKVDVDRNPSISGALQITGVPTMILYRNGQQLWRQSGVMPLHSLLSVLEPHMV